MSKFVDFLRRSFVVAVTCVITVVSMAVAISPPVSAVGVFSPFNFYQLYQMLHGLLLGDAGGNSQTFGEWLEENMTRTVGSGNEKKEFLITPGMKLSDMMTQASLNLVLGAALSDGGIAGTSKIKDLIDSWTEVYDTSDIGEIGSSSGGSNFGQLSDDGTVFRMIFPSQESVLHNDSNGIFFRFYDDTIPHDSIMLNFFVDRLGILWMYLDSTSYSNWISARSSGSVNGILFGSYPFSGGVIYNNLSKSGDLYYFAGADNGNPKSLAEFWRKFINVLSDNGFQLKQSNLSRSDFLAACSDLVFSGQNSDGFIGPVYAMPAAKQLITNTGTLSGLRLDIQSEDGTPDISAALDHAGVDNVNDLVAGVAAGTIPMSQVYDDMRVVPYVLTDVDTGEIVTDLNVSATDAKTKAVALDKDLSIPKDISAADAYQITGKTWDPSLSKYKLPLFDFFPFCLPYDAYQFLTMLDVTPVAPVFQVDTTPLFSHTRFFHAADGYKITLDLTKYEEVFQILRAGECLAIVVGLCLISYKLIHGGD